MKFKVKVDERTYEVEVGDLSARPIMATIDGETFEVWPEEEWEHGPAVLPIPPQTGPVLSGTHPLSPSTAARVAARTTAVPGRDQSKAVYAPIPGVIVSTAVAAGDKVTVGQELCVLEAMKMKNIIRAARPGTIGEVHVTNGQHVKHRDLLLEYAD